MSNKKSKDETAGISVNLSQEDTPKATPPKGTLSDTSKRNLQLVHPTLRLLVGEAIKEVDFEVIKGTNHGDSNKRHQKGVNGYSHALKLSGVGSYLETIKGVSEGLKIPLVVSYEDDTISLPDGLHEGRTYSIYR